MIDITGLSLVQANFEMKRSGALVATGRFGIMSHCPIHILTITHIPLRIETAKFPKSTIVLEQQHSHLSVKQQALPHSSASQALPPFSPYSLPGPKE